ncbi:hypothetical protein OS493_010779 [Desmophyllum pertusum]|uniref:Uncharacterized protein n=1 Tax=Desmophyllum pertusum TaxID=174260 RepID=A0A9W9ZE77_9CNID|nr:hypothetical protein OS493_010779 [Desmophyllum pertusum]
MVAALGLDILLRLRWILLSRDPRWYISGWAAGRLGCLLFVWKFASAGFSLHMFLGVAGLWTRSFMDMFGNGSWILPELASSLSMIQRTPWSLWTCWTSVLVLLDVP